MQGCSGGVLGVGGGIKVDVVGICGMRGSDYFADCNRKATAMCGPGCRRVEKSVVIDNAQP